MDKKKEIDPAIKKEDTKNTDPLNLKDEYVKGDTKPNAGLYKLGKDENGNPKL